MWAAGSRCCRDYTLARSLVNCDFVQLVKCYELWT